MLVAQEMGPFQEPITGKDDFLSGLWPQQRSVIANPQDDGLPRHGVRHQPPSVGNLSD
jgi:hypothetical protein